MMIIGNIRKRLPVFAARAAKLLFFPALIALPGAARGDNLSAAIRYSYANRSFPADSFSTATLPSNTTSSTQLRIAGNATLWGRFFSSYDLRYGVANSTREQNGIRHIETRSGLQDQNIGIGYQLGAAERMLQWIRISAIIPSGPVQQSPKLSSGHWAIEPAYHLGFPGPWGLSTGLELGTRVFVDGGSAQLRARFQVSKPLTSRLSISSGVTLYRSVLLGSYDPNIDRGELSDILRPGVQLRYRLHGDLDTYLSYEKYIAGKGGHASQRVTFGLSVSY